MDISPSDHGNGINLAPAGGSHERLTLKPFIHPGADLFDRHDY